MSKFSKLAKKVGSDGLAAHIGREKYGKKKFQEMAEKGKKKKSKMRNRNKNKK